MDFRILGSLEVWDGERQLELGGPKRRAVLAYLLLHANEVVAVDRLVDQLWGQKAPRNAAGALHTHVSRLRKELGPDVVARRAWGYVLRVGPEELDLERFERLVANAESLPAGERAARLREALALWRGPPLEDLAFEPALGAEIARLADLRLNVLENRIDADLEAGDHEGLIAELEALVGEHPLHERLRGQLILALYRSRRQAEALEVYRETRRVLVEELGIEPSPELKELERAILRQDPALAAAPPPQPAAEPAAAPPRRWRWPRSPLAIGSGLLLLACAGLAAGLLLPTGARRALNGPAPANAAASTTGADGFLSLTFIPASHDTETTAPGHSSTHSTGKRPDKQATTSAATRPHTTTGGSQPGSKPPRRSRDWVYVLADEFGDLAINPHRWQLFKSSDGLAAVEQNGRLELSVDPTGIPQGAGFDTHYASQCEVGGDFDARVRFQLLDWPPKNGLNVYLAPLFLGVALPTFVARTGETMSGGNSSEAYSTGIRKYGYRLPTSATAGVLRVTRVNGTLETYVLDQGRWVGLGSRSAPGTVRLLIGINANAGEFGQQRSVVALDGFEATAETVDCFGSPLPPRKRRGR